MTLCMTEASLLAVQALHQDQHQHHVAPAHHHLQHTLKSHAALPVVEGVEETWVEQQQLLPALEAQNLSAAFVVKSAVQCFTSGAEGTRDMSDPGVVDVGSARPGS